MSDGPVAAVGGEWPLPGPLLWQQATAVTRAQRALAGWRASVPDRFAGVDLGSFAGMDPPPAPSVVECLSGWVASPVRNVIVIGSTGSGKTGAAIAAVDAVVSSLGVPARFWVCAELLDAFRAGDVKVLDVAAVPLLVLDDLGAGRSAPTDYEVERIEMLVNRRYLDRLPTVVTSNLTPEQLLARIGDRAYDRLREGALAVQLTGQASRR